MKQPIVTRSNRKLLPPALWHGLRATAFLWMASAALPLYAQSSVGATATATAQSSPVEAVLTQMLVTFENGKEVLKPVNGIKPGDVIEYRVVYTNRASGAVRDMQATLPIPQGLEYQARSAQPSQTVEVAVSGGAFGREPLMRDLGNGKTEVVPAREYRSLRWSIAQIPVSGKAEVRARARMPAATPVDASPSASATSVAR